MEATEAELEVQRQQIRVRIEQLRPEWEALQARLQEVTRALERRPRPPEVRCQIHLVAAAKPPRLETAPVKVLSGAETSPPMDPMKLLEHSARGTALFAPGYKEDTRGEIVLLIRGDSRRLEALGESPRVQFRAGVFAEPEAGVALVPVLVCLGPEEVEENLYEAWVNQSPAGFAEALGALAAQEDVALYLYGNDCRLERTLRVPNPLRAFARGALDVARAGRPLSIDAFHQARAAVYKRHPRVGALWRALKG